MKSAQKILLVLSILFFISGGVVVFYGLKSFSENTLPEALPTPQITPIESSAFEADSFKKVIRVIDGDTIEIEGDITVRYIGVNTPETVDPRQTQQCFGKEASNKNKELVEGKLVRLERDISETDRYGRLLRYVWLDDLLINDYLVQEGFAQASSYPPDVKYQELFLKSQAAAQQNKKGLWAACRAS